MRLYICVQIVPLSAYTIEAQCSTDGSSGLAGATFYTGSGEKLSAQGIRLTSDGGSTQRGTLVAPPGSYFAALWIGNWNGGTLQVRLSCLPPCSQFCIVNKQHLCSLHQWKWRMHSRVLCCTCGRIVTPGSVTGTCILVSLHAYNLLCLLVAAACQVCLLYACFEVGSN